MPSLKIVVNNKDYHIACDAGQEGHVQALANEFEGRVKDLASKIGQSGDNILLIMASLMMADELHELRHEIGRLKDRVDSGPQQVIDPRKFAEMEKAVSQTIEQIAERIETIAERMEKS